MARDLNPFLTKLSVSNPLDPAPLAALDIARSETIQIPSGSDIAGTQRGAKVLNVLVEGWACRYKVMADGRRMVAILLVPGDVCDLDALRLDRLDHLAGAVTNCVVAPYDRAKLLAAVDAHPKLASAFLRFALVENAMMTQRAVCLGRYSAREHTAHLLCELAARLAAVGRGSPKGFRMPLTQQDLADVLGLTTVHVNRVLQGLRGDGLIRLHKQQLTILDGPGLAAAGLFDPDYLNLGDMRPLDEGVPPARGTTPATAAVTGQGGRA